MIPRITRINFPSPGPRWVITCPKCGPLKGQFSDKKFATEYFYEHAEHEHKGARK